MLAGVGPLLSPFDVKINISTTLWLLLWLRDDSFTGFHSSHQWSRNLISPKPIASESDWSASLSRNATFVINTLIYKLKLKQAIPENISFWHSCLDQEVGHGHGHRRRQQQHAVPGTFAAHTRSHGWRSWHVHTPGWRCVPAKAAPNSRQESQEFAGLFLAGLDGHLGGMRVVRYPGGVCVVRHPGGVHTFQAFM